jgi:hypothetical protein
MSISLKTHKFLWSRSGGKCAICKNSLIVDPTNSNDDLSIVGDEAHIIARKESFTRGDFDSLSEAERDQYSNLILLCKNHHKQIDDQPNYYTVERLREIKSAHEAEVKTKLTTDDEKRQQDDIIYAAYIDEWAKLADLDDWRNISTWVNWVSPMLPKLWYDNAKKFLIWIIGRIWPNRYTSLEQSLLNYKAVLQDFLNVFDQHIDYDVENKEFLVTKKFYHISEWDEDRYEKLAKEYDEHARLVCDLFFELTRAANYVCDHVRETIFPGYRLQQGALLIERHNVGYELKTINFRCEYRGEERTELPYPGLKAFKDTRYTRDYALDPKEPEPPCHDKDDT